MTEINLLRWNPRHQKKPLKLYIATIIAIIFIFLIVDGSLNKIASQSNDEAIALKSKLELMNDPSNDLNIAAIDQLQFSQKKLWTMLNLLACVNRNQVQVIKIALQDKQINITGSVDSAVTLTKSLEFCLSKDLSVNKMIFSHKNQTDFLQFSLVII